MSRPAIPADKLATPTLGAWRRAHDLPRGLSPEARHHLAVTMVQEAQRLVIAQRLDSIQLFLRNGATADQAAARLAQVVADYYTPRDTA